MVRAVPFILLPFLAFMPAAHADDYPARKPGLWEITMNMGHSPPRVSRMCIDAATDAEMRDKGMNTVVENCSRRDIYRSGDVLTADTVCRFGTTERTTHTVTTFIGDAAYRTISTSHAEPPTAGRADTAMTVDGKWLGACGPDMVPGDITTPAGKVNIRSMPRGVPK